LKLRPDDRLEPSQLEPSQKLIREVPDFPNKILFYDITTLLKDSRGFHDTIDGLKQHYQNAGSTWSSASKRADYLRAGPAYALNGFSSRWKPKKLPSERVSVSYELEYGTVLQFRRTRSAAAIACSSSTICWPPAVPRRR
jgi:adenine/guanine phosphoribosyltransferase-like PRPP-binding protein